MYQESPLRKSPDLYQYKNEWAYLQDLQQKKQSEFQENQNKLENEIKKNYRQDLKLSMDQHSQILKEQEYQRRGGSGQYQSLHDRQMSQYHDERMRANEKNNYQCRNFNQNLIELKKQQQMKEKEIERANAERRIKEAQDQQLRQQEMQYQEKEFVKHELLNANHAQEEIKRHEIDRINERNRQLAESEFKNLSLQDQRREQFLDGLKQRYYRSMNNPIQNIYLENHLKQQEDRRNLEKKLVDDYNYRKQQQDAIQQALDAEQRLKVKSAITSTLKNQIALKQEAQHAVQADKIKYHDFLQQKDKEILDQQSQVKQFQDIMKKEYTNELKDQIQQKTFNNKDYMDRRELKINQQIFDANGLSPSVPGMFQDHQRIKQLQMINNCLGYQNKITTPQNIQMFQNPRSRFQSSDESQNSQGLNYNSSAAQLHNHNYSSTNNNNNNNGINSNGINSNSNNKQNQDNYYNISSPQQQYPMIGNEMRRNNSVFLQQGKQLIY